MGVLLHNMLFFIPAISGLIFLIVGFIMLKFPAKKINYFYGYRTASAMKNKQNWDFAQYKSALEMLKMGGVLVLCGFLLGSVLKIPFLLSMLVSFVLVILAVVIFIYRVEKAIKNNSI